jgi:hypothetical protein
MFKSTTILSAILTCLLANGTACGALAIEVKHSSRLDYRLLSGGSSFTASSWLGAGRLSTLGDLIRSHNLIGMSRTEVHDLLGVPSDKRIEKFYSEPNIDLDSYDVDSHGGYCGQRPVPYFDLEYSKDKVLRVRLREIQPLFNDQGEPIIEVSEWVAENFKR